MTCYFPKFDSDVSLGLRLLARVKPSENFLKSISKEVTKVEVTFPSRFVPCTCFLSTFLMFYSSLPLQYIPSAAHF